MKNSTTSHKFGIALAFIIFASLAALLIIIVKAKSNTPEKTAQAVLTRTYGSAQQDYQDLNDALTKSQEDDKAISDYLHTVYGGQLSESGYTVLVNNRIPSKAPKIAYDEGSDLKVTSIELKPADALAGSKRYNFTVEVQTENNPTKTYSFNGSIVLTKVSGHWIVDGIS